jgi:hypothetical protein
LILEHCWKISNQFQKASKQRKPPEGTYNDNQT